MGKIAGMRRVAHLVAGVAGATLLPSQVAPAWGRAHGIPRVEYASMVFDGTRTRLVLFGGQDATGLLDQTWEWDGIAWTHAAAAIHPSARIRHAMAFAGRDAEVVLFGGAAAAGPLGDTWVWNGATWTPRTPSISPAARFGHRMVYDSVRQVVVCFGGRQPSASALADTWEWNGVGWVLRTPTSSPAARFDHAMAYDGARQRTVLFGGETTPNPTSAPVVAGDTWEWDGANWQQRQIPGPPARSLHGMAHDPIRQRTVVYGGGHYQFPSGQILYWSRDDVWEFDGAAWVQGSSIASPGERYAHAMAYDEARQRTATIGGIGSRYGQSVAHWEWDGQAWQPLTWIAPAPPVNSTMAYDEARDRTVLVTDDQIWEFSGATWEVRATGLPLRFGHAVAYDRQRRHTVLFGGNDANGALLGDTHLWDGVVWSSVVPAGAPSPRTGHAMAQDAARGRIVLFGGSTAAGLDDQTWEWDGVTWSQRFPAQRPTPRRGASAAYDAIRQVTVLYGGSTLFDTWEWDGTNWVVRAAVTNPGWTDNTAMAFDAVRQRTLLIGGGWSSTDVWQWDGTNWSPLATTGSPGGYHRIAAAFDLQRGRLVASGHTTRLLGALIPATVQSGGIPCGGTGGMPTVAGSLPYLGNPRFRFELIGAPAGAPCLLGLSPILTPQSLGAGCTLYVGPPVLVTPVVANVGGFAETVAVRVPSDLALRGITVHVQGLALDATAPLGFSMTGWRTVAVGD